MKSLLLVDDDRDEYFILSEALRLTVHSHVCHHELDAGSAMKYLATARPDLILVDLGLPIVNGVECIWMIKQLEHLKNTHVVLYSAPVSDSTAEKAIRFGATLCMEKTSDMNKLVAQLDDFFLAYF